MIKRFLKKLFYVISSVRVSFLAAQTSFFVLLAFFPFCIFMLTLIRTTHIDDTYFIDSLTAFVPSDLLPLVLSIIQSASDKGNIFWSLSGIVTTLWLSSRAVHSIIYGINSFYVFEKQRKWGKGMILALVLILALISLIFISLAFLFISQKSGPLSTILGLDTTFLFNLWEGIRFPLSAIVLAGVFTTMYIIMPNKKVMFREVVGGVLFSTISWFGLTTLFSYIISNFFMFSSIYGSIGSIILMLMWLFWGAHIILLGAAINSAITLLRKENLDKKRNKNIYVKKKIVKL